MIHFVNRVTFEESRSELGVKHLGPRWEHLGLSELLGSLEASMTAPSGSCGLGQIERKRKRKSEGERKEKRGRAILAQVGTSSA